MDQININIFNKLNAKDTKNIEPINIKSSFNYNPSNNIAFSNYTNCNSKNIESIDVYDGIVTAMVDNKAIDTMTNTWRYFKKTATSAASTAIIGFESINFGSNKFLHGVFSDYVSGDLNVQELKHVNLLLKSIYNNENYEITDKDVALLLRYHIDSDKKITDIEANKINEYYKKNFSSTVEYDQISSLLQNLSNNITIDEKKDIMTKVLRLTARSIPSVYRDYFYKNTAFGRDLNKKSHLKYNSNMSESIANKTEDVLIITNHAGQNFSASFANEVIPFANFSTKAYEEGKYFSDKLGEEQYNKIANNASIVGKVVGITSSIGIDAGLTVLTGGTYTAASTYSMTAKVVDKTSDTLNLIDKFSDSANVANRAMDTINTFDKIEDSLETFDNVKKVVNSLDDYVFKIDLDGVPPSFRESYKNFFNSQTDSIKMKKNIGESLEDIFDTDNYVIGIHKAGIADPDSILSKGLYLTGDSSSGVAFNGIDLNNNIVFERPQGIADADFLRFCKNIERSAGYKTVTGEGNAIIIKIPKADFDDINKLTFFDGTQYILKNDYIAGYVKTHMDDTGNVIFENIVHKNEIIDGLTNSSSSINSFDNITKTLSDFKLNFNDSQSDNQLVNLISKQFEKSISNGNEDAISALKKLIDLKQSNPKLKFKIATPSKEHAVSYYSKATDSINIMPYDLKKESLTNFHELFHMIDYEYSYKYNKYLAPNNYSNIFDNARENLLNSNILNEFIDKYKNRWKFQQKEANILFSKKIGQAGFDDFDSYRKYLIDQYNNVLSSSSIDGINKYIDDLGIKKYIKIGKVDGTSLADADIASTLNSLRKEAYNNFENSWGNVSDIVDAVLNGQIKDNCQMSGHGVKYYSRSFSDFKETIANFGALKVGAPERLDDVKYFLGEEFYDFMENAYNLRIK